MHRTEAQARPWRAALRGRGVGGDGVATIAGKNCAVVIQLGTKQPRDVGAPGATANAETLTCKAYHYRPSAVSSATSP